MRKFVCIGHDVPTSPTFSLDDLPGSGGRLDVLCRALSASLFLSHGIRETVQTYLVLQDEVTIRVNGGEVKYASPDERNLASLIQRALERKEDAVGHAEVESTPGIHVSNRGLVPILDEVASTCTLVHLHEGGGPLDTLEPPENAAFVLSDHREFTDSELDEIQARADHRVTLGPRSIHGDHAISVAHNYLDTDGYRQY
ncbi:MAG: tRNA (pseudouridine(54)-N(1))-methyltransferase TrmY [Halobacteriaceae archaeon]